MSSWPEGRDFVEVYVSSVANPDTFFVQILTSMSLQLDEVVKEMSQYYCKEREVRGRLFQVYQLNTQWKKDKILAFVCLMKNLYLYFSKKILVLIHYVYLL